MSSGGGTHGQRAARATLAGVAREVQEHSGVLADLRRDLDAMAAVIGRQIGGTATRADTEILAAVRAAHEALDPAAGRLAQAAEQARRLAAAL